MNKLILLLCTLALVSCDPQKNNSSTEPTTPPSSNETQVAAPEGDAIDTKTEEIDNVAAYWICYNGDNDSPLKISINFNKGGRALKILYKGQTEAITLEFIDEIMENEGAYPVTKTRYAELYEGKINGTYLLTHSGNWDYVEYVRGIDQKLYSFTIDHKLAINGSGDGYRDTPCYPEESH